MKNTRQPAHDYPEREDAVISAAPVQPGAEPRWTSLFARMLLPTMLFAMSMMGIVPSSAKAAPNANANAKATIAADLRAAIASPRTRRSSGRANCKASVTSRPSWSATPSIRNSPTAQVRGAHGRLGAVRRPRGRSRCDEGGPDPRHGARNDVVSISPNREPPHRQHAGSDHRRRDRTCAPTPPRPATAASTARASASPCSTRAS